MTVERVREILAAMRGKRMVVGGDVMLDRYVWGEVSRISPEAPVPVVEATRQSHRLGGAANVAANIVALGGVPYLLGVLGQDGEGAALKRLAAEQGIPTEGLVELENRPTTAKTRIIARNQQMIRLDIENTGPLDAEAVGAVTARSDSALREADGAILSDYGKGVITEGVLTSFLATAAARDVPVSVDPKDDHFQAYRGVTVLTPNLLEAGGALGRKLPTDEAVEAGGEELRARLDATSILITRGERGMSLIEADRCSHFPTVAEEVYDVTGAGDTVVSVFALAHIAGASLREAAEIANHAASLVIREVGTAVADPEAIAETFERTAHGTD